MIGQRQARLEERHVGFERGDVDATTHDNLLFSTHGEILAARKRGEHRKKNPSVSCSDNNPNENFYAQWPKIAVLDSM